MKVLLTALAELDVLAEDEWWRTNRDETELFHDELAAALVILCHAPRVGTRVRREGAGEVRRLNLRKTRRHLFYVVDETAETVTVPRVCGAQREEPPQL